ncbi:MAG: hypothetical protein N3D10_01770 [Candidatus Micrarchaeota archaeon]|nr:hypothetical protein [Candidatus Micrarchaeota archaeon]
MGVFKTNFFILIFLFSIVNGTIIQNEISTMQKGDVLLTKNCIIELQEIINPNTGAKTERYNSLLTLELKNTKIPKQRMLLEQDSSFIPNNIDVKFSLKPTAVEGNYYKWDLGALDVGEERQIKLFIATKIECERFLRQYSTALDFSIPSGKEIYKIYGPKIARVGEKVIVQIVDLEGKEAANIAVTIRKPSGQKVQYYTDKEGKINFLVDEEGKYFVESIAQQLNLMELIEVQAQQKNQTTEQQPKTAESQKREEFDLGLIYNIGGLVILIGALIGAYFVYKKIIEKKEEEEVYISPAASAVKEESKEYSKELQETLEKQSWQQADQREEEEEEQKAEEEGEEEIEQKTSLLLEKRRKINREQKKIEQLAERSSWQKEQEQKEEEEQKFMVDEFEKEAEKEELEEEEIAEEEIDDEAIKKTIEELEQLRLELKKRGQEQKIPPESAISYEKPALEQEPEEEEKTQKKKKTKKEKPKKQEEEEKQEPKIEKEEKEEQEEELELEKELEKFLEQEEQEEEKKKETKKEKGKERKEKPTAKKAATKKQKSTKK